MTDDATLLAAAADGDDQAFAELVERHADVVIAVCRRHLGAAEAEDAAQEAFVNAWRRAGSFAGRSSVRTWLYRIAVNAARDRLRHRARRPQRTDDDVADLADRLADPRGLDDALAEHGIDDGLRRALATLPAEQRDVVVAADVLGVPLAELAERHGVAVGTVKSRRHRGHARLADLLAAGEEVGPREPAPDPNPSNVS